MPRKPALTPEMIRELNQLKGNDGRLDTEAVVRKAKEPTSALHLHPAFEWDVRKAAEQQWRAAAREIISVWVEVVDDRGDGERAPMRVMVSIADEEGERHYEETKTVLRENRPALINSVLDRIVGVIRSYPLAEFDPILTLIERIRREANNPPRSRGRRRAA